MILPCKYLSAIIAAASKFPDRPAARKSAREAATWLARSQPEPTTEHLYHTKYAPAATQHVNRNVNTGATALCREYITTHGQATIAEIVDATGMDEKGVYNALNRMTRNGEISVRQLPNQPRGRRRVYVAL